MNYTSVYILVRKQPTIIIALFLQFISGCVVSLDLALDLLALEQESNSLLHTVFEAIAVVALWLGVFVNIIVIKKFATSYARLQDGFDKANGAIYNKIMDSFEQWNLSPSEHDVALLILKGFSNTEIARIRNKSIGTIKTQATSVYRKSGVQNRSSFMMTIIDEFMEYMG